MTSAVVMYANISYSCNLEPCRILWEQRITSSSITWK